MREEDAEQVVNAVDTACQRTGASGQDHTIWALMLARAGLSRDEALKAVADIASAPTFVERFVKRIGPGDVIAWHKATRERRISKAGPLPPPPDPDNPRAAIERHRLILDAIGSGMASPSEVDPTGASQASQRRADAIRRNNALPPSGRGRREVEAPASAPAAPDRSRILDQARNKCREASEQIHNQPAQSGPAPAPARPPGRGHTGARKQASPAQAGDALRALFGPDKVPDWIDGAARPGRDEGAWCGRCHREDGSKITVNSDGQQVRTQCCIPQRVSA